MKKIAKKDLKSLVEYVTQDVATLLKSEDADALAKADPGEEAPAEKTPEGSALEGSKDDAAEDSGPPADASPPPAGPPADASPPAGPPADAGAPPSGDPAADASAGLNPEAIKAEIAHLSVDELKMYALAFKSALMDKMAAGGDGMAPPADASAPPMGGDASAPPVGGPPPGPPMDASAPPMGKGEFDDESGKVSEGKMAKSDKDQLVALVKAELRGEISALQKAVQDKDVEIAKLNKAMTEGVNTVAEKVTELLKKAQGARKAVTGLSFYSKPGETPEAKAPVNVAALSKAQVIERLNEVARKPGLKKSDSDMIVSFSLGKVGADKVVHLLG